MVHHSPKSANKIKTWLLIVGIVAVVGLDLAFTTLIDIEKAPDVAIGVVSKKVNSMTLPSPTIDDSLEPASAGNDDTNKDRPTEPHRTNLNPSNVKAPPQDIIVKPASRSETDRKQVEAPAVLQSQPQKYPRPSSVNRSVKYQYANGSYFVRITDGLDVRSMDRTKDKKKSFVSKALPVIKKPWQWMKALVSKLK